MSYNEVRRPYEFDERTKREALKQSGKTCALCGEQIKDDEKYHFNHEVSIWYALEIGDALPAVVIRSLCNCQITHVSCHKSYHSQESRKLYREKSPQLLARFLQLTADEQDRRDEWRHTLK